MTRLCNFVIAQSNRGNSIENLCHFMWVVWISPKNIKWWLLFVPIFMMFATHTCTFPHSPVQSSQRYTFDMHIFECANDRGKLKYNVLQSIVQQHIECGETWLALQLCNFAALLSSLVWQKTKCTMWLTTMNQSEIYIPLHCIRFGKKNYISCTLRVNIQSTLFDENKSISHFCCFGFSFLFSFFPLTYAFFKIQNKQ